MTGGPIEGREGATVERVAPRTAAVVIIAIFVFAYLVRSILWPFVLAGAVAFVATPLIDALARRTRLPRLAIATAAFLAIVGTSVGLFALALPPLIGEVKDTTSNFQEIVTRGVEQLFGGGRITLLGADTDATSLAKQIVEALHAGLGQVDLVAGLSLDGVAGLIGLILTTTLLFYFLASGPHLVRSALWLVPPKQRALIEAMRQELHPILLRYFVGLGIVVLYAVGAAYLGLGWFLHIHDALLLAVITGFCEVVPVIGPIAAILIGGLAALRGATGIWDMAAYVVYAIALRLSIDQVVSPLVLGRAARVHPVLIIFCFLAGGALFGIVGLILAVPVALTMRTVLATLYDEPPYDSEESSIFL